MKRLVLILLGLMVINMFLMIPLYAANPIKVELDGKPMEFDVPPTNIEGRIMVPLRMIFEALGANVEWNGEDRIATGTRGDITIVLQVDHTYAQVNDKVIELDVPATILDGRTLVPARFISESLRAEVQWVGETNTVLITSDAQAGGSNNIETGIKKGEFISALAKVLGWHEHYLDLEQIESEELVYIAQQLGMLSVGSPVDFDRYLNKQEIDLFFIRSIGYNPLIGQVKNDYQLAEYTAAGTFSPVEELILNMYQKVTKPIEELHAFYAINSYPQIEYIPFLDEVSFGWSRLEINNDDQVELITARGNSFFLPDNFSEPVNLARENNVSANLMIFASQHTKDKNGVGLVERITGEKAAREQVIEQIISQIELTQHGTEAVSFDGVVIDFEDLIDEKLAENFNAFLFELKNQLDYLDKKLYVAVQPRKYFKGYDYRTIGEIADKVILMAHNYYPLTAKDLNVADPIEEFGNIQTPTAPVQNNFNADFDVYSALRDITDSETGVADPSKIWLQISFDAVQWRKGERGNGVEVWRANPTYQAIKSRLVAENLNGNINNISYNKQFESPVFTYIDNENQVENIIWYEDSRSIMSKINLAKLFGINGISIWRLGNIPDYAGENENFMRLDAWQKILEDKNKD